MVGEENDSTCTPHSPLLSLESLWDMIDYYVRMKNQIGCIKEQSEVGGISHHLGVSIQTSKQCVKNSRSNPLFNIVGVHSEFTAIKIRKYMYIFYPVYLHY